MRLLRTAARASVATRVIGNTHRRQQQRWAAQDVAAQPDPATQAEASADPAPVPPAAQPAPAAAGATLLDQLTQLGQLRDSGVLTEAEFEAQKLRILSA